MNEVYNIDCMEYMRTLPDKAFDLAIVDPPYGINIGTEAGGQGSVKSEGQTHSEARKIRVGGLSACRPKHIRHLMTATHQMPTILNN